MKKSKPKKQHFEDRELPRKWVKKAHAFVTTKFKDGKQTLTWTNK